MTSRGPQVIYPVLRYADAPTAIDWLEHVLGFERGAVYEEAGKIVHAQVAFGDDLVMLGSARDATPDGPVAVYLVAADVHGTYERAKEAGGTITMEIADQDYGSREFSVQDPEGNTWSVGTYQPADQH